MSGWLRVCLSTICSVPGFMPLAFTNLEANICPSSVFVLVSKQDCGLRGDCLTLAVPPMPDSGCLGRIPWRALEDWTGGEPGGSQRASPASHILYKDAEVQRERVRVRVIPSICPHSLSPCWVPDTVLDTGDMAGNGTEKTPPRGNVRDAGSIPGSGRSPGGGHGNPLQYSCLGNPMDRGAWRAAAHRLEKSWM